MTADQLATVRSSQLGFVFQNFNLLPRATALENIELPLLCDRGNNWTSRTASERARECLRLVGLEDRANHFPNQLSGGQQQRVAIARALANRPRLILADEPTGNLDGITSLEILSLLQQLHADGITILMVTHEFENSCYGTRRLVLRDGMLTKDEVIQQRLSAAVDLENARAAETLKL